MDGELFASVYHELRRLAGRFLRESARGSTLQPTALVHEAWIKLSSRSTGPAAANRLHFFRIAARAMRDVLIDHARAKARLRRGGERGRLRLTDVGDVAGLDSEARAVDLLALDEALTQLADQDAELARLVELRFFSGLTIEETSSLLEVSTATVERQWRVARAWLKREMRGGVFDA